ncbi:DUF4845 domain-containing protein [Thiohalobacter sp. COW1]|uniref:DUF4845 domain-containing protein n=1 Tax=Thiohalobacter thiocyanaticus TaxID=585455 RepID=A0A1Z4VQ59_9GAMM|nr:MULTISPECIES: DUF4845 domain-containing protein [Thiohalobacter]BAZ93468.1 uncharacterized protein FOKN1_1068 [Thiohalobacter thiocyanaticus]BCO31490.1 DUF4845 domain-containing protein [Thiohalobacter sp. COW1]HSH28924.1 DUF4845 domain-containing protein [Thiohalobacter sp.]
MHYPQRQQGMTLLGWIIVLGLIAFFVLLTLRLLPNYLENFKVAETLASLKNEPDITRKSPAEIRKLIDRRFIINDVTRIEARDVTVTNDKGRVTVRAQYEIRVPVLGNVDAVTKFDESVELIRN